MKKLFYLLFITSVVLVSCHKHEHPIEINCGNAYIDAELVGHWRVSGVTSADNSTFVNDDIDLYIDSAGAYVILTSAADGHTYGNHGIISILSNNKIRVTAEHSNMLSAGISVTYQHVFNYSIQNWLLNLEDDVLDTDHVWQVNEDGVQSFGNLHPSSGEVNNLTKQ